MKFIIILFFITGCSTYSANKITNSSITIQTDNDYLVLFILKSASNRISNKAFRKDLINFQNKMWQLNRFEYEQLKQTDSLNYLIFSNFPKEKFGKLIKEAQSIEEFKLLRDQNENYKNSIAKQWSNTYESNYKIIQELIGHPINFKSEIIITHPGLKNGRNLKNKYIKWGGIENLDESMIYLWHEILHESFSRSNLDHVIIELIADHELRKQVTGQSYPPYVGHKKLEIIINCLSPYWLQYLDSKHRNIEDFKELTKVQECGNLFTDLHW